MTTTFVENVLFLVKERGLPIGEIERNAGVTIGYFSRFKKSPNRAINLNVALSVADQLGCTVDELCKSRKIRRDVILAKINELEQELERLEKEKEKDYDQN